MKQITELIKVNNLMCTENEFKDYFNRLNVDSPNIEIRKYKIEDNIENPAQSSMYYTLYVGGKKYIQTFQPFVQGYKPINEINIDNIIEKHVSVLNNQITNGIKSNITFNYFKRKKDIYFSKIKKIENEFQKKIKSFTAGYSQAEIDTWNTKVEEAKKVLAGETSDLLNSLLIEGENVEDFATNILNKASEYSKVYCEAERIKREKLSAL